MAFRGTVIQSIVVLEIVKLMLYLTHKYPDIFTETNEKIKIKKK